MQKGAAGGGSGNLEVICSLLNSVSNESAKLDL
jgi:hypothetical protein